MLFEWKLIFALKRRSSWSCVMKRPTERDVHSPSSISEAFLGLFKWLHISRQSDVAMM